MLNIKFGLIGQVVSEKMIFEYYGDIHVYCPVGGVRLAPGAQFFSES